MSNLRSLPHPWPDVLLRVGRKYLQDQTPIERHPWVSDLNKRLIETGVSIEGNEVAVLWDCRAEGSGGQAWGAYQRALGPPSKVTGERFEQVWKIDLGEDYNPAVARQKGNQYALPTLEAIAAAHQRKMGTAAEEDAKILREHSDRAAAIEKSWKDGEKFDVVQEHAEALIKANEEIFPHKKATKGEKGFSPGADIEVPVEKASSNGTKPPDEEKPSPLSIFLREKDVSISDFAEKLKVGAATVDGWLESGIPPSREKAVNRAMKNWS